MKKIILIIVLIIALAGTSLVSATGIVQIPVFSDVFYREKISDLGIEIDREAAEELEQRLGILGKGLLDIAPEQVSLPKAVPGDVITEIEITDIGLSSWINITCLGFVGFLAPCPFENFQIKFLKGGYVASVRILNPFEVNITVFGAISRRDEKSINLKLEKVYVGNLRMPFIGSRLEREAEVIINKNLRRMEDFRIDRLEILEGRIVFEGVLDPRELSNLLAEGLYYKPMVEDLIPRVEEYRVSKRDAEKLAVINWWEGRFMIPENKPRAIAESKRGYWLVTIQIVNMFTGEIISENAGQYKVDKMTGRIREYKNTERAPRVPEEIEKPYIKEEDLIRAEKLSRDAQRKADIRVITVAQHMYYGMNNQYYQSANYPLSISNFLPKTLNDPLTKGSYGWVDNIGELHKFCVYAELEKSGWYTGSHKGNFECSDSKPTLADCCF